MHILVFQLVQCSIAYESSFVQSFILSIHISRERVSLEQSCLQICLLIIIWIALSPLDPRRTCPTKSFSRFTTVLYKNYYYITIVDYNAVRANGSLEGIGSVVINHSPLPTVCMGPSSLCVSIFTAGLWCIFTFKLIR